MGVSYQIFSMSSFELVVFSSLLTFFLPSKSSRTSILTPCFESSATKHLGSNMLIRLSGNYLPRQPVVLHDKHRSILQLIRVAQEANVTTTRGPRTTAPSLNATTGTQVLHRDTVRENKRRRAQRRGDIASWRDWRLIVDVRSLRRWLLRLVSRCRQVLRR